MGGLSSKQKHWFEVVCDGKVANVKKMLGPATKTTQGIATNKKVVWVPDPLLNSVFKGGVTACHLAALLGNFDLLVCLLQQKGATVNPKAENGYSMLHLACCTGQLKIAHYLISKSICKAAEVTATGQTCLHLAATAGYVKVVKYLLIINATPINSKLSGSSGHLALAKEKGLYAVVQQKLRAVAGLPAINVLGAVGDSPLALALRHDQVEVALLLVKFGAPLDLDLKACAAAETVKALQAARTVFEADNERMVNEGAQEKVEQPTDEAARARAACLWQVWSELESAEESLYNESVDSNVLRSVYKNLSQRELDLEQEAYTASGGKAKELLEGEAGGEASPDNITLEYILELIGDVRKGHKIERAVVADVLDKTSSLFKALPNVVSIHTPENHRLVVLGDIHGQLPDLLTLLDLNGYPSQRNAWLFNGDIVDRGKHSVEVLTIILLFKLLAPDCVHINRGNHEDREVNTTHGFEKEVLQKYDVDLFEKFAHLFSVLPLAALVNDKVFVVHGGLSYEDFTVARLQEQDRFQEVAPHRSLIQDILWSDPRDGQAGRTHNPRGAGCVFGADTVAYFLASQNLDCIVRSHECLQQGYKVQFQRCMYTVFSASNYMGVVGNSGAFCLLGASDAPTLVQFDADPTKNVDVQANARLVDYIATELLKRISVRLSVLLEWCRKEDEKTGVTGTLTREQWATGLKEILLLDIPFLELANELGFPQVGVNGSDKGPFDYVAYLSRFRPTHKLMAAMDAAAKDQVEIITMVTDVLFDYKRELTSMFRYYDMNRDGRISAKQLEHGLESICKLQMQAAESADTQDVQPNQCTVLSEEAIAQVMRYVDAILEEDGQLSYEAFFNAFTIPALVK